MAFTSGKIWEYDANGNRGSRYMYVTVSQTKGSSSENQSTINWTITTGGASYYTDTGPTTLNIGGAQRYYQGRVGWGSGTFPATNGSKSGSFTVKHNDDGTCGALAVSLSSAIFTGSISTVSGSLEMEKIDRYFSSTPGLTLSSATETTMNFTFTVSEACSAATVYYKKSSASSWSTKTLTSTEISNKSFSLSSLSANTTYNVYIKPTRSDSGLASSSATINPTTYNYPYVKSVSKNPLTIGEKQTLTVYNPLGRTIDIYMRQNNTSGTILLPNNAKVTDSTGTKGENLTKEISPNSAIMYGSIPNSQSGTAVYYCVYSSQTVKTVTGTYQITGSEVPVISNSMFTFSEGNSTVKSVAGAFVQSLSTINALVNSFPTVNATGKAGSISSCKVTIGGGNEKAVTAANQVISWANLNLSGQVNVYVTATDSRGLTSTKSWWIDIYPYSYPSISGIAARVNNYGTTVDITANYKSSTVTVGSTVKNGIKVQYSGASKSGYLVGSSSAYGTAGNSSAKTQLTGIDNNTAYTFTFTITDKFGQTATATANLSIGLPLMFVDSSVKGVGVNKFPSIAGVDVNGPIQTNTNVVVNSSNDAGTIKSSLTSSTHLAANKGRAIINGTAGGTGYNMLFRQKSTNGVFTGGSYGTNYNLYYTADSVISAGTNSVTKSITLLNESGNTVLNNLTVGSLTVGGITSINFTYPVGAIYLSYTSTSPASLFGGTWSQITGDYYLMLSNGVGTGGSNSTTYTPAGSVASHTLTESQIPSHGHLVTNKTTSYGKGSQSSWRCLSWSGTNADWTQDIWSGGTGGGQGHSHGWTGTAATITINPKYYKVYAWRRTA